MGRAVVKRANRKSQGVGREYGMERLNGMEDEELRGKGFIIMSGDADTLIYHAVGWTTCLNRYEWLNPRRTDTGLRRRRAYCPWWGKQKASG
jgi:hypothetical protein